MKYIHLKYRTFTVIFFLFVISFIISGCSFKDIEMGNIEGIELLKVNKDGIDFNIMLPITNNNKYAFSIRKVNLIINSKSGSQIATITSKKNIRLDASSKKTYRFNFSLKFTSVKNVSLEVVKTFLKRSANLKITGHIKIGKFIFTKNIKVDEQRNYQLFRNKDTKIQFP